MRPPKFLPPSSLVLALVAALPLTLVRGEVLDDGELKSVRQRPPMSTIQPANEKIMKAQATAVPRSPVSDVKGQAFDRVVQIWLENVDYEVSVSWKVGGLGLNNWDMR